MSESLVLAGEELALLAGARLIEHDESNGPGEVVCPVCHRSRAMRWKNGVRQDFSDDFPHAARCPVRLARMTQNRAVESQNRFSEFCVDDWYPYDVVAGNEDALAKGKITRALLPVTVVGKAAPFEDLLAMRTPDIASVLHGRSDHPLLERFCPMKVGQCFWVREAWRCVFDTPRLFAYRVSRDCLSEIVGRFNPPETMPPAAARFAFRVVSRRLSEVGIESNEPSLCGFASRVAYMQWVSKLALEGGREFVWSFDVVPCEVPAALKALGDDHDW